MHGFNVPRIMVRMFSIFTYVLLASCVSSSFSVSVLAANVTWEDVNVLKVSGNIVIPEVTDVASTRGYPYSSVELGNVNDVRGLYVTEDYGYSAIPTDSEAVTASVVFDRATAVSEDVRQTSDYGYSTIPTDSEAATASVVFDEATAVPEDIHKTEHYGSSTIPTDSEAVTASVVLDKATAVSEDRHQTADYGSSAIPTDSEAVTASVVFDGATAVSEDVRQTADYGSSTIPTDSEAITASVVLDEATAAPEDIHQTAESEGLNATLDDVTADPTVSSDEVHTELLELLSEVQSYQPLATAILGDFTEGPEVNRTYDELAAFVDRFGHRMAGTPQLENAIDYLVTALQKAGVDNVATEPVNMSVWTRGEEKCRMVKPREMDMDILGLGGSVPTVDGGITARVVLVKTFDELAQRKDEVNGSIVVYKPTWKTYESYVPYRTRGAVQAARFGALAALVRSATPFSLYTVHTGTADYAEDVPRIPTAAITVEDADVLDRILARGQEVILHLNMKSNYSEGRSRNIVADIKGTTYPEQYVIAGAHTDSWDVGQGAMDDGGGVFINVRMAQFLQKLKLRPKRTIRIVLWTAEEIGLVGGKAFAQSHQSETDNISIALESDYGTFMPYGLTTSSRNNVTQSIMLEALKLLQRINATELQVRTAGSDVRLLDRFGVPVSTLLNRNEKYFHYHHTRADTMSMMDKEALDLCTAMWVAVCYVFADLSQMLPR